MMVFWNRFRHSQVKILSNQLKKCYLPGYPSSNATHHIALHTRIGIYYNPSSAVHLNDAVFHFPSNARFYAAPVQVKKKEEKDTSGPRLNEKITAPVVRLVLDEGHFVVSRHEALNRARSLELDLVEVQRTANPPVCKLMDYNKEKYKQQMKDKERAKSKINVKTGVVKEVRFKTQITQNDIQMKADTARRLLEAGYRVKCLVKRKKKEDDLEKTLSRLSVLIEDIAVVEYGPSVEEEQAHLILRHVKLGPPKKGSGKKIHKSSSADGVLVESSMHSNTPDASSRDQKDEDRDMSEEDTQKIQPSWSVSGSNDNFDRVFDVEDDDHGSVRSLNKEAESVPANRYSPSMRSKPSVGTTAAHTENRYRRDPSRSSVLERSVNSYGSGHKDGRLEPPSKDLGRQPQFSQASTQRREAVQREPQPSRFGNQNFPAGNFPRQNSPSSGVRDDSPSSYGILGVPRASSSNVEQNSHAEGNRYRKTSFADPTRSSISRGSPVDRNSSIANSRFNRGSIDRDEQGKFGVFSSSKG